MLFCYYKGFSRAAAHTLYTAVVLSLLPVVKYSPPYTLTVLAWS